MATVVADTDAKVCRVTTVDYGTGAPGSSASATITVKVTDESSTSDTAKTTATAIVKVIKPIDIVSVTLPAGMNIVGKETIQDFAATLDPAGAHITEFVCTSSDESVFTVTSDLDTKTCKLTSHKIAKANLTVTVKDENENQKTDTKEVNVTAVIPVPITDVLLLSLYKVQGNEENTKDVSFTISPNNGTPDTLECISSNTDLFTATADLANRKCVVKVGANTKGTGTLTVKVTDLNGNSSTKTPTVEVYLSTTGFVLTRKSDGKVLSESDVTEISTRDTANPFKISTDTDSDIVISFTPEGANELNNIGTSTAPVLRKADESEYKGAKATSIADINPHIKGYQLNLTYTSNPLPVHGDTFSLTLKNSELTFKTQFKVRIPVEKIALKPFVTPDHKLINGMRVGDAIDLENKVVFYWGANEANTLPKPGNRNLTYNSTDPSIVSVDASGMATALKAGYSKITVTSQDGNKTASLIAEVFEKNQDFTIDGVSFTMVSVPVTYYYGRIDFPSGEDDSSTESIYKNNQYFLGDSEVTWDLWQKVRDWATSKGYNYGLGHNGSTSKTNYPTEPVTKVDWCDAAVFSNALTAYYNSVKPYGTLSLEYVYGENSYTELKNGGSATCTTGVVTRDRSGFRLPTSTEWEMAARWVGNDKGSRTDLLLKSGIYWTPGNYASGATATIGNNNETMAVAWVEENSPDYWTSDTASKVKQKLPNALGIYDMTGNVWEWHDTKDAGGTKRYTAGGSCNDKAGNAPNALKIGYKAAYGQTINDYYTGIRLARSAK